MRSDTSVFAYIGTDARVQKPVAQNWAAMICVVSLAIEKH